MANSEAIVLRLITKGWKIIELLVRLKLFQNNLTAEELANRIVEGIFTRLHLKLKNWLASQQYQASTNKCCLKN